MGRNKKKQTKTSEKKLTKMVSSVSSATLSEIKAEIAEVAKQYETLAAEFKAISNRIKWKEKAVILERGRLLKERSEDLSTMLNIGLIEKQLSEQHGRAIIQDTKRFKVDMSADLEFQAAHEKINGMLNNLKSMQYRLGVYYLNELVLIYIKCLILKSKFLDSENKPAMTMQFMQTTYMMLSLPFNKGKLKYTHAVSFQREVAWLFEMLNEYATTYRTDISDQETLLAMAMEGSRFAEKCENEALKLNLYFRALCKANESGKLMLLHPRDINVADLYHLYDVTKRKFFDLIARKAVDAKAILDFVDVSFMIFIFKNTSSHSSLYWKNRDEKVSELNPLKRGLPSDADFRAHLEMTKRHRLEFLESALRLLLQTNLSIVFSDMAIYDEMKRMLINYRSHLYTNVIALYQGFLKKRAANDNLGADVELEIIQFERLAQILLDCFQYLEEFQLGDVKISQSNAPYVALQHKEEKIKAFKEEAFLQSEKVAKENADIVSQWQVKLTEFETKRLNEEKKTTKKKPFYKDKKVHKGNTGGNDETNDAAAVIDDLNEHKPPFENEFDSFMNKAAEYIAHYQYAHAITAYDIAKQMATRGGDTYKRLCAIDGLIYASGAELLQHLDYLNAILSYRLHSRKVMKPEEQKSLLTLLIKAVDKFKKIKMVYEEYEVIVSSAEIASNTDIQAGVDHGKALIEELLNYTEAKVTQAQLAYEQLESESQQEREHYIYKRGWAEWKKAGNKDSYTLDQIVRLGKKILRQEWIAKITAYSKQHGDKAFSSEDILSHRAKERELLKEMEPLMADLRAVPASIRPSVERIVTTGRYIMFSPSVWCAFARTEDLGGTQLLVGENVVKLLRGLLADNASLPDDAIWIGKDTEGNCAKYYASKQFFTKTTVCCNRSQRLIDTCQTGVDDILNFRLKMVAADPLEQINLAPECLIEAIQHMRADDIPEAGMERAMREWAPGEHYSQQYLRVLAAIKEQFSLLPLLERINRVKILIDYGLMEKLFDIKHKESQRALWSLEDKWLGKVSVVKFHLLANTQAKKGSLDDMALGLRKVKK